MVDNKLKLSIFYNLIAIRDSYLKVRYSVNLFIIIYKFYTIYLEYFAFRKISRFF